MQMDRETIDLFVEKAKLLASSEFLKSSQISATISYSSETGATDFVSNTPQREHIESFAMRIRIFLADKEMLHLGRFLKGMELFDTERAEDYRKFYRFYVTGINASTHSFKFLENGREVERNNYEVMWDVLYGDYFHVKKLHRERLKLYKNFLGPISETQSLIKLEIFAMLVIRVGRFLEERRDKILNSF